MSYPQVGRVVTAAVLATAGAALLGLLLRRRPDPVPVVRCPIHGIAYDTELELCPECAKTPSAAVPAGTETHHRETKTTGGAR